MELLYDGEGGVVLENRNVISGRATRPGSRLPIDTPSMNAVIVDESARMSFGFCVSTQPLLAIVPLTTPLCAGASMAPNGFGACALSHVMVFDPRSLL